MLKPLIKYTGGKYKEYENIKQYFPEEINNYYEPFFGGGGVYFRLHNENKVKGKNYINDFSDSLIEFYHSVQVDEFANELNKISDAWDFIRDFAEECVAKFGNLFHSCIVYDKEKEFINTEVRNFIEQELKNCKLNFHGFSLNKRIESSINDKLYRFRKKNIGENELEASYDALVTCICQAFYFTIRDMYNDWNNHGNKDNYSREERSAHWLFIREYCFGSMFRFDSKGNFNIPYGGKSYNNKCFSCKIDKIISEETKTLFRNTDIQCKDFEEVINGYDFQDGDFMFLDPPYDSTFSEYDDNGFNRDDHKRLAKTLKVCKCKWLMAIGKTDFIADLYKDCYVIEYNKTYMYQARGEYDNKHTTHLLITNYPI